MANESDLSPEQRPPLPLTPEAGASGEPAQLDPGVFQPVRLRPAATSAGQRRGLVVYWANGSPCLLALAYVGFFLSFFNLLPITPLDGGRVAASISRHLWWAGGAGLLALLFYRPSPVLVLMLVLAAIQLWNEYK